MRDEDGKIGRDGAMGIIGNRNVIDRNEPET